MVAVRFGREAIRLEIGGKEGRRKKVRMGHRSRREASVGRERGRGAKVEIPSAPGVHCGPPSVARSGRASAQTESPNGPSRKERRETEIDPLTAPLAAE